MAILLAAIAGTHAVADRVFEVQLRDSNPGDHHGTWVGVFPEPIRLGAAASGWQYVEGDSANVDVPDTDGAMIVAVRQGAVSTRRVAASEEGGEVYLRFERGVSVPGAVRDTGGRAIAGAGIVISAADGSGFDLPGFVWPQWRTDRSGAFIAHGLAAGRYTAVANAEGYVMLDDVEFEIPEPAGRVEIVMAPAFHVSGRVLDGIDDRPAVGAEVTADVDGGSVRTTETDSRGRFRAGPFAVGERVRVVARSDGARSSDGVHLSGPRDGLVLKLKDGVRVAGVVADGTTGSAVAGFVLTAYANPEVGDSFPFDLEAEVLDSFAFDGTEGAFDAVVDWRTATLTVHAPGYSPWSTDVQFAGGESFEFGRVLVHPQRPVSGQVVDGWTRAPVAGAKVTRHGTYPQQVGGETTVTDGDGTFHLARTSVAGYSLTVSAPGYAPRTVHFRDVADRVTIEMDRGGTVVGTLSTTDGVPISGVLALQSSGDSGLEVVRTRATGRGRFEFKHVRAGVYRLFAQSDGRVRRNRQVTVADGRPTRVAMALEAGRRMTGVVSGLANGERVTFSYSRHGERVHVGSGYHANGAYAAQVVPSGPLQVSAKTTAGRSMTRAISDETGHAVVDFPFPGGSVLKGVVRAGNTPMRAQVTVVPQEDGGLSTSTDTDATGFYELSGLPDGDYILRAQQRHAEFHETFDVSVAGDTVFDVALSPLTISGVVRSQRTLSGGWIRAARLGDGAVVTTIKSRIGSGGSYRLDGLEAGRWRVTVEEPFSDGTTRHVDLQNDVSGFDFSLTPSGVQDVWIAADPAGDRPPLVDVTVESGDLAGEVVTLFLGDGGTKKLPLTLVGQRLTFEAAGYFPQTVERWEGGALEIGLRRR